MPCWLKRIGLAAMDPSSGILNSLNPQERNAVLAKLTELQIQDSMQTFNSVVERCFSECVTSFRSKALDKAEEDCVKRCVVKTKTFQDRVTQAAQLFRNENSFCLPPESGALSYSTVSPTAPDKYIFCILEYCQPELTHLCKDAARFRKERRVPRSLFVKTAPEPLHSSIRMQLEERRNSPFLN